MVGSGSIGEVFNSVAHSEMLKTPYLGFTPVDFLPKISWLDLCNWSSTFKLSYLWSNKQQDIMLLNLISCYLMTLYL